MAYHLGPLSTHPKAVAARERYWARVSKVAPEQRPTREWSMAARSTVLNLAGRPDGVVLREIAAALACSERAAQNVRVSMARAGFIVPVRQGCNAVWFDSQAAADAWAVQDGNCWQRVHGAAASGVVVRHVAAVQVKPEKQPRQAGPAPKDTGRRLVGAAWALGPVREQGVIVGDERIQVLDAAPICRGDMRFQVMPGERVVGAGFSALKPGQYLDDEGASA